jgi:protease-4
MEFVRFQDLLKKIGIQLETLKSGEFKDIGSPNRKLSDRDKELLNALIADIQSQFVSEVAKGRNLPVEKVREIADGRILTGAHAQTLGLVDRLGNFQDAVELAKKLARVKGEVILVYPQKSRLELWELFLDSLARSLANAIGGVKTGAEYRWNGS